MSISHSEGQIIHEGDTPFDERFKKFKTCADYELLNLWKPILVRQIKEGKGDAYLSELLVSEDSELRIAAQKRVCWLERRK